MSPNVHTDRLTWNSQKCLFFIWISLPKGPRRLHLMWIPSRVTRKINPNRQVGLSPKSRPKYLWFQWMLVGRKDHDLVVWIHGLRGHGGGPRFAGFGGTRRPSWRVNSRYIQNPKDSGISTYVSLGSPSWDKGKTWNDHKLFHSPDWWCLDEWVYFVCSKGVFECCSKLTQTTTHKTARFPKILQKRQSAMTNMQKHLKKRKRTE